jgi:hypothetical protein
MHEPVHIEFVYARFRRPRLTMRAYFAEQLLATDHLSARGAFLPHRGIGFMAAASPRDSRPMRGERQIAGRQSGNARAGTWTVRPFLAIRDNNEPVRAMAGFPEIDDSARELTATPFDAMYLPRINPFPVDRVSLIDGAR